MVTWPDHLTRHSISSEQFKQSHNFNSPQTTTTLRPTRSTLDIRCQTYAYDLNLHPMSFHQFFEFSPTSLGAMQLGLLIFIFHFLGGNAGGVTLALSMKVIGLAAIMLEVVPSHCSAPWSHLETWWGTQLEKSPTLNVTSASMEADRLDAWLPQKQPGLGLVIILLEKLHCLALPTAPKAKKHRDWNRMVTCQL